MYETNRSWVYPSLCLAYDGRDCGKNERRSGRTNHPVDFVVHD